LDGLLRITVIGNTDRQMQKRGLMRIMDDFTDDVPDWNGNGDTVFITEYGVSQFNFLNDTADAVHANGIAYHKGPGHNNADTGAIIRQQTLHCQAGTQTQRTNGCYQRCETDANLPQRNDSHHDNQYRFDGTGREFTQGNIYI